MKPSLCSQTWTPQSHGTSDMDLQTWTGIRLLLLSFEPGYLTFSPAPLSPNTNGSLTSWPLVNNFYENKASQDQQPFSLAIAYSCADGPKWDVATQHATISNGFHVCPHSLSIKPLAQIRL
eukprot:scaffold170390_cov52-Attheya_sp.AAC.1